MNYVLTDFGVDSSGQFSVNKHAQVFLSVHII